MNEQAKPYLAAQISRDRIVHGGCIDVLRRLPGGCTDFVLTDPPYVVRYVP